MTHFSAKRLYIGSPEATISTVFASHEFIFNIGIFDVVSADHVIKNSLFAKIKTDHISNNAILVSADHVIKNSLFAKIKTDHISNNAILVSADHVSENSIRTLVVATHISINTFFISSDHAGLNRIGFLFKDTQLCWSLMPAIANDFVSINAIFQQSVSREFIFLNSGLISNDTVYLYSIKSEACFDFISVNFLAFSAAADFGIKFDLLTRTPVAADFVFPNVLTLSTQQIENSISAIINSQNINLFSLDISSDENTYCISLAADIADMESWMLCEPGLEIEITINTILYNFLIDSRERSLEFGKKRYSISGRSMTAQMGTGYAEPITKTWGATTALAIVDELCTAASISYTCSITDWNIPEGLFAVESLFPIQILKKITDAAGAIMQSTPGGDLIIQYAYPVPPPLYETASPDLVISGAENVFSLIETKEIKPKWTAVLVMDEPESADQYSIEQISENNGIITLAVWAFPFVDEILFDDSYLLPSLSIWEDGLTIEEKEEVIEIVQGNGVVSKPVLSVIETSYENSTDLGSVFVDGTKITTATKGQSLLKIKYNTQYFKIRVQNTNLDKVQFFIENVG